MVIKLVKPGDMRIIKRFALFPITVKYETRWLETVYILQIRKHFIGYLLSDYWDDIGFTDKAEYKKWRLNYEREKGKIKPTD